jgi:DNA-binding response OmpR family regulator
VELAVTWMADDRKKILCIEDDRGTAKLIAEEFSERGFYVVIAYDGRVGLDAILKRIPDLVLCDVGLPEMSGFEVLARVNELMPRFNRVPFVFLTGFSDHYHELQGRNLGADDYVTKPIDFDILEMIIRARLIGGVARHEIPAILPKPIDHQAKTPRRGAHGKLSSKRTMRDQVVELMDAPAVDFHLDDAKESRGTTSRTEVVAKNGMGRLIKP